MNDTKKISDSVDVSSANEDNKVHSLHNIFNFFFFSLIGIFMFFVPIDMNGKTSIPLDHFVTWIRNTIPTLVSYYILVIMILGAAYPLYSGVWRRSKVDIVFSVLKILGAVASFLVLFNIGPKWLLADDMGPYYYSIVLTPIGVLIPIGAIFLALLVGYGLLEFIGILMQPVMRPVWKTPGKSAIDAVASFDDYYTGNGTPEVIIKEKRIQHAWHESMLTARNAPSLFKNVISTLKDGVLMAMSVLPSVMAIGLIGLILANHTPVFDYLAYILLPLTWLLQIPEPFLAAKAAMINLVDMFLPSLMVIDASLHTRFIVGSISISTILFFSALIPCILSTDIPIKMREIVALWFIRTVLSLIIVTPLTFLFV